MNMPPSRISTSLLPLLRREGRRRGVWSNPLRRVDLMPKATHQWSRTLLYLKIPEASPTNTGGSKRALEVARREEMLQLPWLWPFSIGLPYQEGYDHVRN